MTEIEDGIIVLDTERAKLFEFTSDKFILSSYLWKSGEWIYVSSIGTVRQGIGDLSRLFDAIWKAGYGIKVPTPFARMQSILKRKGFEWTIEHDTEEVEVWSKRQK